MSLIILFLLGKIFALVMGVVYYRSLPLPYRLAFYLIIIAAFCESYGYYFGVRVGKNNIWIFNFYMLVEVWLMGLAAFCLINGTNTKKIFFALLMINTLIWAVNIYSSSLLVLANVSAVVGLIILTGMYIFTLFNYSFRNNNLLSQPVFWLSASTILYCACDIPYIGMHNYLSVHTPVLARQLDKINAVLDIIRYPLVAISFILLGRQKQASVKVA